MTAKPAQALPKELLKLRALLQRGLDETASLWPDIACAFGWVQQAARVLENPANQSAEQVHRRYRGLLGAMRRWRSRAGALAPAVDHFLKASRSYWPGLFHCYDVEDLPRTNNDLEHVFGAFRYHERRASGARAPLLLWSCVVVLAWSLPWPHANALALSAPMTWRSVTCMPGAHCVSRWTGANTLGSVNAASGATRPLTWPSSKHDSSS